MITVRTATPEFLPDIGDMLRLFLGDVQIVSVEGEAAYEHSVREADGRIADCWSHGDVEQEIAHLCARGSLPKRLIHSRRLRKSLFPSSTEL